MIKNNSTSRLEWADIAKGIGIILVVWSHADGPFSRYIDSFHMPMFFLVSGFLYKTGCAGTDFWAYIKKKARRLYVPFVFWNISFFTLEAVKNQYPVRKIYTTYIRILLTIAKENKFMGATWFLAALFVVSVLYKIMDSLIHESLYKHALIMFFFCIIAMIAVNATFKYTISRTMICALYYAGGVFVNHYRNRIKELNCFGTSVICAVLYVIITYHFRSNLAKNTYDSALLFIIGAFFASYVLIYVSSIIEKKKCGFIEKPLCYLGRNSIDILLWHFTAFKIIIVLQMILHGEKITFDNVLHYYPIYSSNHGFWVLYLITGLLVSLLIGKLLRYGLWGKVLSKIGVV